MPLGDNIIDAQVRERLNREQIILAIEEALEYGHQVTNPLAKLVVDALTPYLQSEEKDIAEFLEGVAYALLIPKRQHATAAPVTADERKAELSAFKCRRVRLNMIQHLRTEKPGMTLAERRHTVETQLPDSVINEKIQMPPELVKGFLDNLPDAFKKIVAWIKDNWPKILGLLLSLLFL